MEDTQEANQVARDALASWQLDVKKNCYSEDPDYIHTLQHLFGNRFKAINKELEIFGQEVTHLLEPLVNENNLAVNLPRLEAYNAIGNRIDKVVMHPTYIEAGNLIYKTKLLAKMAEPGGLSACLSILFLSSQAGEAGH